MQNQKIQNKGFFKVLFTLALVLSCATSSFAELAGMGDSQDSAAKKNEGLKALIGFSGGNSMIADDGTIFATLRIGLDFQPLFATGVWASTIVSDVRNYNVKEKQLVNYKSFGAFIELFPIRFGDFAISVPVEIGAGVVNALENGDESFESEDYFFTGDMALHFNYRVTNMLEISIGGGYRMFAGIEENNLENMDFCTPFGELRFTVRE
ncbi:MAG: hypothetical protein MJY82_01695 [Fibrobacter sp.]|nr:hypothetical protein [Fibrobacter sp.]